MPLKTLMGNRSRENPSHVKFRTHLESAINSVKSTAQVEPATLEGMLAMVRSKEIPPGDALSYFKTHFRDGTPDEQYNALRVLVHFVDADPHLANMLHLELASKRWRERFVMLAGSANPEVRPLLVATLQAWMVGYRANDIGMHYQSTLRELQLGGGSFRPAGPGYNAQYTGYSAQQTGYSAQPTGAGYSVPPPPTAYPVGSPSSYPAAAPGYPPYMSPYPPQSLPHAASRRNPETVPQKLEQLSSEVEVLRGAIRAFETTLTDYKAQRCNFAALSAAMEKGQRSADRCSSLQTQMEGLLGTADADEAVMTRVFSTNDAAVAALEQWSRIANQELAPDDAPDSLAVAAAASSTRGTPTSAGGGSSTAPPPARPPPTPLDLLLGDELPSPTPPLPPAAVPPAHPFTAAPNGALAATAAGGSGAQDWNAFPAPATGAYPAVGVTASASTFTSSSVGSPPVVPASDMEGLRAQVLALASELEKERKMHKTAMDTQEAFHRQEMERAKVQAQARITELEAALALARQTSLQPMGSAGVSGQTGPFGSPGAVAPAVPPPMLSGLSANNPFATSFSTVPSYISMPPPPAAGAGGSAFASLSLTPPAAGGLPAPQGMLAAPMVAIPPAPAPPPPAAPPPDFFSAFDDLAVLPSKPAAGASSSSAAPEPYSSTNNRTGVSASGTGPGGPWYCAIALAVSLVLWYCCTKGDVDSMSWNVDGLLRRKLFPVMSQVAPSHRLKL